MANIIDKINKAKLVGRGGGGFPVAEKWKMVKGQRGTKYVIANGAEGEPGIKKDGYILEHFSQDVIDGVMEAVNFLSAEKAYIYLRPDYYKQLSGKLKKLIAKNPIELVMKHHDSGYIGGEETGVINSIEGRRVEARLRPPFPTTSGLWGKPTLVNNIETFYDISLVAKDKYDKRRFYTINGDCVWTGVYHLPEDWTIEQVLRETRNYPEFKFFVQIGGDASGDLLNSSQLDKPATGAGSITVYSYEKHDPVNLMRGWIEFFAANSCGQCTPCREGTYRLKNIFASSKPDWEMAGRLVENLGETSICGLGSVVPNPFRTFACNVLPEYGKKNPYLKDGAANMVCKFLIKK